MARSERSRRVAAAQPTLSPNERAQRVALLERLRRNSRDIPSEEIERQAMRAVTAARQQRRKRDRG